MNKFNIEVGAITDKGNVKEINQDNILVRIGEHNGREFGIFVVCDGLGGLTNGEIASAIAIKQFKIWWECEVRDLVKSNQELKIINSMKNIIEKANNEIREYGNKINERVGTTISALFLLQNKYYIVHVGDSRIYKITNRVFQLTEDHSYVAMKIRNGEMTKKEAKLSKQKNILLQCVGVKEKLDIFTKCDDIYGNEIFILSSDGFYGKLEENEMYLQTRKWCKYGDITLEELTRNLVELVKERKERDNISAIIVNLDIVRESRNSIFKRIFKA